MKRNKILYILSITLILRASSGMAQTVFWTEDWSISCSSLCTSYTIGPNGAWTIASTGVNGTKANIWYFSNQEEGLGRGGCGAVGPDPSMHIGSVKGSPAAFLFCPKGDCGAAYDASNSAKVVTNTMAESPVINCTGESTITLSFNYIMNGQTNHDYGSVYYNTGSGWTLLVNLPKTATCGGGQGKWTYYSIAMPASANNNANVQIGFNWQNNGDGAGNDPSIAIDSIQLSVPTVLPIQLISFTGDYDYSHNVIAFNWSTASETNNAMFTVERILDDEDSYTPILNVKGAGNSSQTRNYSAIDLSPVKGTSYYRLKQTDYDGHYTYSNTIAIEIDSTTSVTLFPNPAGSFININYYALTEGSLNTAYIYDAVGRQILSNTIVSTNKGTNTGRIDISKLTSGIYFVQVQTSAGQPFTGKFIKQ
jgi:hypothetical protein